MCNKIVQRWAKFPFPGLVNFVPAVAYHLCLKLPAKFSKPGNDISAQSYMNSGFMLQASINATKNISNASIPNVLTGNRIDLQCKVDVSCRAYRFG